MVTYFTRFDDEGTLSWPLALRRKRQTTKGPRKLAPGAELLLIWAVIGGLLLVHALLPEPLRIFGHELARPDAAQFFGLPSAADTPVAERPAVTPRPQPAPLPAGSAPPTGSRAPDPEPQRMLIFGDSMIEGLLPRLADYAAHNGHSVDAVIWYGSRTIDWGRGTRLAEILQSSQPTFVFVVLGSSELHVRNVEKRSAAIERMLQQIGPRKLVWVGPPNWTSDTGINELIARTVGKERFFRSAELDFERKKDGIHPTLRSSERWMDAIVRFVVDQSSVPIRLETPAKSGAPRPRLRVYPPPTQ